MFRGYIKVWRKVLDTGILKNHKLWSFWMWCLLKASHEKHKVLVGYQEVELQEGQFIFGRKNASEELNMSEQNIRTVLKNLEKSKNLTIKTTNKFSVITILNWELYQGNGNVTNQQTNKELTNNSPATNHKQECKNDKNEKNKNEEGGKKEFLPLPLRFELIEKDFNPFELKCKKEFLEYWMEKSLNGKKERWQFEKVFDIKRRFRTWLNKNFKKDTSNAITRNNRNSVFINPADRSIYEKTETD